MDIFDNPFYILQASCRDNKRTIMSLAEEKSLLLDPGLVAKAKDDLINPRKRLPVEMAWLPGLSSKVSNTLLSCLKSSQFETDIQDYNVCDLAELNLLVSSLLYDVTMNDGAYNCLDGKILRIAELYEYLDSDEIIYVGYYSNSLKDRWWKKKGYFWHGEIVDNEVNKRLKENPKKDVDQANRKANIAIGVAAIATIVALSK